MSKPTAVASLPMDFIVEPVLTLLGKWPIFSSRLLSHVIAQKVKQRHQLIIKPDSKRRQLVPERPQPKRTWPVLKTPDAQRMLLFLPLQNLTVVKAKP